MTIQAKSRPLVSFILAIGSVSLAGCFSDPLLMHSTTSMGETDDGDETGDGDGDETSETGETTGDETGDGDGDGDGTCGNSMVEPLELCDDGNEVDGDGCDNDCSHTQVLSVHASALTSCVLLEGGNVRCWGQNFAGQLGYGHNDNIGDDETPASAGNVMLPAPGIELTIGEGHTCILMSNMAVRCWGQGFFGELGYGNTDNIGDDEYPTDITDVMIGGPALEIDAGASYTCVRLANGKLRCWGLGDGGQLGYGNTNNIGDDELPDSAGDVPLGTAVASVSTGYFHTCVVTPNGSIRCWGTSGWGALGYGNIDVIGDDEPASNMGNVAAIPMGLPNTTKAIDVACSHYSTCALFDGGHVLCWGAGDYGLLGQGNTTRIGDDELPNVLPPIPLPAPAVQIVTGDAHACALLDTEEVICWGLNDMGQLGYGHTNSIGDDETLATITPVDLGGPVQQIDAGGQHTCALMADSNEVYCWGSGSHGELGYGNVDNIGDDELPLDAGPVPLF